MQAVAKEVGGELGDVTVWHKFVIWLRLTYVLA